MGAHYGRRDKRRAEMGTTLYTRIPPPRLRLLRFLEVLYGSGRRQLARALGFHSAKRTDRVRRWYSEAREPAGDDLMVVLRRTGLLQPEAVALWDGVSIEEARLRVDAARAKIDYQHAVEAVLEEMEEASGQ
jgi:hypothetical protein